MVARPSRPSPDRKAFPERYRPKPARAASQIPKGSPARPPQDRSARECAFFALRAVHSGAFADIALDQVLRQTPLNAPDRRLVTELVYGSIRRQRTLDALITQFATKPIDQQPQDLRWMLHLGLYQMRYLDHVPASAAVDTTVEMVKQNGFPGLTGFANGLLRQYIRLAENGDPLALPTDPIARLGTLHSYPDWIIEVWLTQFGLEATEALCTWFNRSPHIDLRINPLKASLAQVESAMQAAHIAVQQVPPFPQALRLPPGIGSIQNLPGFHEGWWSVQDCSAQIVSHLLDPQPGETVIDACAAPGGKTTHIAELMQDQGVIWGCDRQVTRLKKVQENATRLQIHAIQIHAEDSRNLPQFIGQGDRVLIDAPCSGLGTLHRHADARWRQSPASVQALAQLQTELLNQAATWVKPQGTLVYATCTLHPDENEAVIDRFLQASPQWRIIPPEPGHLAHPFATERGWLKVLPHQQNMDGFFIVRLRQVEA
jgi:16S rRNA (cytosine967-C5)-methyltransferase